MPRATIGGLGLAGQDLEGPTWSPNLIRKTQFCGGIVSKLKMRGLPVTRMDCMVPRRPLGKPVSPQTPFKKWFPSTFPNFGKFGKGPPGSEGLAILSTYLVEPLLLYQT